MNLHISVATSWGSQSSPKTEDLDYHTLLGTRRMVFVKVDPLKKAAGKTYWHNGQQIMKQERTCNSWYQKKCNHSLAIIISYRNRLWI